MNEKEKIENQNAESLPAGEAGEKPKAESLSADEAGIEPVSTDDCQYSTETNNTVEQLTSISSS